MTSDNTRDRNNHSEAIFNFILHTIAVYHPCLKPFFTNYLALLYRVAYNVLTLAEVRR
jgi:hypothetical protein